MWLTVRYFDLRWLQKRYNSQSHCCVLGSTVQFNKVTNLFKPTTVTSETLISAFDIHANIKTIMKDLIG